MHFAARYSGRTYREFASDYRVLVDCNIKCHEDFGTDAVSLISDPYRETSSFGGKIIFPEDSVPQCREILVKDIDDVRRLKRPDLFRNCRTLDRINGAREYRRRLLGNIPIIGWIEGPLAESCDLAGVNEILLKTIVDPDMLRLLIERLTLTAKDFARAQVEAGCDIIGIGDAICSQISADQYRFYVKDRHQELVEYIQSLGAKVKIHICGNITHLIPDLKDVNPDILDLDWMVDMDKAYEILGDDIIRCGNLDPVAVIERMDKDEVVKRTTELIEREKGKPFILSGGCEITVNTPKENLLAMRQP
jgi:uroporphyrinogen decarboxylase